VLSSHHVLIIRLSAMGDVAMSVPVIRAFTKQYPNCKITVVSKPFLRPLFDGIPNVSFFAAEVTKNHKGIMGLFRLYVELKKQKITHIADFHNVLRSKILRTLFFLSGKPCMHIDKGRAEKKALTRSNNKIFKQLKTSHQRYAEVLNKLGFNLDLSNPTLIEKKKLSEKITIITGLKTDTWIGIAPFAAFKGKVYPLQLMEEVIKEMASKGFKIFLFGGGKHEVKILNTIEKTYKNVINLAGQLSFKEELEVISKLDLMVSMDSGNAHLAAMQQVKTITLWGVTHPYAGFAPFHQPDDYCLISDLEKYPKIPCSIYGNKVINGYENVMETISPDRVIEKIMSVLSE
jgi:ADP-heptose:LPS heptosyltransferase